MSAPVTDIYGDSVAAGKGRKKRRSYNCGPCKKQKIKCDLQTPCGNCIHHNRQAECAAQPPNPPSPTQVQAKTKKREKLLARQGKLAVDGHTASGVYGPGSHGALGSAAPVHYQPNHAPFAPHMGSPHVQLPPQALPQHFDAHPHAQPFGAPPGPLPDGGPLGTLHPQAPPPLIAPDAPTAHPGPVPVLHQAPYPVFAPAPPPPYAHHPEMPTTYVPTVPNAAHLLRSLTPTKPLTHLTHDPMVKTPSTSSYPTPNLSNAVDSNTNLDGKLRPAMPTSYTLQSTGSTANVSPESMPTQKSQTADEYQPPTHPDRANFTQLFIRAEDMHSLRQLKASVLTSALPPKPVVDRLVMHYLDHVNHQHDILNRYLVTTMLNNFWTDVQRQNYDNISFGFLSLLFAICAVATTVMDCRMTAETGVDSYSQATFDRVLKASEVAEHFFKYFTDCFVHSTNVFRYDYPLVRSVWDQEQLDLLRIQSFCIAKMYFYITKQFEAAHMLLAEAISTAQAMGLHRHHGDPNHVFKMDDPILKKEILEERKKLWWELCYTDTYFALLFNKNPMIRSYHSKVNFPSRENQINNSETEFHVIRYKLLKILNGIYEIDELRDLDSSNNVQTHLAILRKIIRLDKEICSVEVPSFLRNNRPLSFYPSKGRHVASMIQTFIVHITIYIARFRLFQGYLSLNIPMFNAVCYSSVSLLFKYYKALYETYPVEEYSSFYYTILPEIHSAVVTTYVFLFQVTGTMAEAEKREFIQNINVISQHYEVLKRIYDSPTAVRSSEMMVNSLSKLLEMKERKCSMDEILESFKNFLEFSDSFASSLDSDSSKKSYVSNYINSSLKQFYLDLFRLSCPITVDFGVVCFYSSDKGVLIPDEMVDDIIAASEKAIVDTDFLELISQDAKSTNASFASNYGMVYCILGYGVPRAI